VEGRTIVVLEGDETGQELLEEALRVVAPDVIGVEFALERFDLSLASRRETNNGVVHDAARAVREAGLGLKAATITPEGAVVLVKQFRPAVRRVLTEIPAGLLDVDGEDALTCASRELFEETGYRHEAIEFLGAFYSSAGFTDEYVHLFWARTRPTPEASPDPGIEIVVRPLDAMVASARAGRIRDAKTTLALLLADGRPSLP